MSLSISQAFTLGVQSVARRERLVNGRFEADVSGWTQGANHTLSWSSGKARIVATNTGFTYQAIPTVIGKTYRFEGGPMTTTAFTSAGFRGIRKADNASASSNVVTLLSTSSNGTFTVSAASTTFVATATTTYIILQVGGVMTVEFERVSVIG